jgi:class 3 adenylate cyclase
VSERTVYFFDFPSQAEGSHLQLRIHSDAGDARTFPFKDHLEIGRYQEGRRLSSDILLIDDPTVSHRHCVLTRAPDGRCFLRDTSRNGTWVDGRRLVPNVEVEIQNGQVMSLGHDHLFVLEGSVDLGADGSAGLQGDGTLSCSSANVVTVLVGDIRDYTAMVQMIPPDTLQRSVRSVFAHLEKRVADLGGAIHEYQGDAIFAYWEARAGNNPAVRACHSALLLDRLCREMAEDARIWPIPEFPLKMDWALATGLVVIRTLGGDRPSGLSMVGEPVVLAYRIEKLADDATGPIIVCDRTFQMIGNGFETRDLGYVGAKGFENPIRIHSILGERGADGG